MLQQQQVFLCLIHGCGQVFLVPDAAKDERFKYSSLVVGPSQIRFYAGAPLQYEDAQQNHYKIGALCLMDTVPCDLTAEQIILLQTLARLVCLCPCAHASVS